MKKLPKLSTIRNKADALLTPIVKAVNPYCLLCKQNKTEVAHHHIHKSQSTRLRYEFKNLINLCNACHFKLHQNESFWASKIIQINGIEWFNRLEQMKNEYVKADVHYYLANYEKLKALLK